MASIFGGDVRDCANDAFDEIVFGGPDGERLLDAYNGRRDCNASDLLYEIIDGAEEAGKDAAEMAVDSYIRGRKAEFINLLEGKE